MVATENEPPVDKPGWFMRTVRCVTPRKWHKYYTKEAFLAYNLGGLTTDLKWLGILAVPWDVVTPVLRMYWAKILGGLVHFGKVVKESVLDFVAILFNGT